jgi:hypothetical protein
MENQPLERWKRLCEEASTEQNPERLRQLVAEIDILIQEKLANDRNSTSKSSR